jgi:hypothetical protein
MISPSIPYLHSKQTQADVAHTHDDAAPTVQLGRPRASHEHSEAGKCGAVSKILLCTIFLCTMNQARGAAEHVERI